MALDRTIDSGGSRPGFDQPVIADTLPQMGTLRQRWIVLLGVLALLTSCAASRPYDDERPDFITGQHLASVVVLGGLDRGIGTGVVIAPDRFVTALHVIEPLREDGPRLRFQLRGHPTYGTVIAQGEGKKDDWAVVQMDTPIWSEDEIAVFADSGPVPGEKLWSAGYASYMFPPGRVDPGRPAPMVRTTVLRPDPADPGGIVGEGRGLQLSGMSGGGLFRWNASEDRLELLGVFSSQIAEDHFLTGPFGLRLPTGTDHRMYFRSLPNAVRDP